MSRIGSAYWAKRALANHLNQVPDLTWEPIGSGSYRTVYKRPTGKVVYKITQKRVDSKPNDWGGNELEHANAELFKDEPWCPPTTLYRFGNRTVLAMPYYPARFTTGPFNSYSETDTAEMRWITAESGIDDVKSENLRRDSDGNPILIDLGYPSTKRGSHE